jgi:Domain of Unknown Function (DUF1080)/FG-GAP-like repeat
MAFKFSATMMLILLISQSLRAAETIEQLFNGSNLNGWTTEGGRWQVRNGEIVGSAADGGGWLTLKHGYEDVILEIRYQCKECVTGLLLRKAPLSGGGERSTGIYLSLTGPDSPSVYRLTLDKEGKEIDRKLLASRVEPNQVVLFVSLSIYGSRNRDGHYFSIKDLPDGSKQLHFLLRGDLVPANLATSHEPTGESDMPAFGQLSLHIEKGEVRFKQVALFDLTRPRMGLPPRVTAPGFRELQLNDRLYSEGITAGDVNHDGVLDVVSGPYAYLGPDYQHTIEIYQPRTYNMAGPVQGGEYTDSFLNYLYDFNGDGWPDLLKVNFEGAFLYLNPQGESRHWQVYKVVSNVSAETTQLGDIDGDGKPEFIMSTGADPDRTIGYAKPDWTDVTKPWTFHPISAASGWSGHGMGYADINGDGRIDILQGAGWFEQPAAGPASGLWKFHEVPFGRGKNPFIRGADLLVSDVNGDGLPDVITSYFSHGPGLGWFEQHRAADGTVSFTPHTIMDAPGIPMNARGSWEETDKSVAFTELHALSLVDMDGDGLKDIVTGKRWWSHGIEFEENDLDDPAVMYWFKLVRKADGSVAFVPHLINNFTGLGTQIFVTDLNGDGTPDVMTAARKGAFIFFKTSKRGKGK